MVKIMYRNLIVVLCFSVVIGATACSSASNSSNTGKSAKPNVKTGVAPVADNEVVVLETDFGQIKIELYSNVAPKHVARFKELVKEGFYNDVRWHRINQQVVQAGNAATKTPGWSPGQPEVGSTKPNVEAEFSDLKYEAGTVGAARLDDPNSFNAQFFITLTRVPEWEGKYTVFGKVVDGMNNVVTLSGVPKQGQNPDPPVYIKSATIQPK